MGDITTDAFIHLNDATVEEGVNHTNRLLCVRFGDKVPYDSVEIIPAVGNSANAAVAASRLGLRSGLVAWIGDDDNGVACVESLAKNNVDTRFITVEKGKKTNYHYVLWYGDERTILIKHEEFSYALPAIDMPKWIYLSSIAENSLAYQHSIAAHVKAHPETKLAFQPGTFQIKESAELKDLYEAAEVFFCNVEEAQRILDTDTRDPQTLLDRLHVYGPRIVVITDGPQGAYALDSSASAWFMPIYPDPKPPLQRTGAGDAFSSTFTAALALGKTVPEALRMAPVNSMHVVQYVGAQAGLLSLPDLESYLAKAPPEYQVRKL